MASKLMHDGGGSSFRFDLNPTKPKTNYWNKLTQGHKKAAPKPKPKASNAYGSGNLNKLVKKYNPPKKAAPKKKYVAPKKAAPKKSSSGGGGAYGSGGQFFKNGYVDSKGNRVINGRWAAPAKKAAPKRSSGGGGGSSSSSSYSAPKKATTVAKAAPKKIVPKKTAAQIAAEKAAADKKFLAGDTQYQNELGGLSDALARYLEQNKADTGTLTRSFHSQVGNPNARSANGGGSIEKNRKKSQVGNSEGFAKRGMLRSGGYSDQASDINTTYKEQTGRVTDAYNDDKNRLTRASSAEKQTVNQKREQARVAALTRKGNQEILKAQASSQ